MAKDETISELRDQIGFLRRELERKDAILMSLTQRVPELEAPPREPALSQEPPGASRSGAGQSEGGEPLPGGGDRKSTRLNSSHANISYAVFCLHTKK